MLRARRLEGGQKWERWKRNCLDPPVDPRSGTIGRRGSPPGPPSIRPSTGPTATFSGRPTPVNEREGQYPCRFRLTSHATGPRAAPPVPTPRRTLAGFFPRSRIRSFAPPFPSLSSGSLPVRGFPMQPRSVLLRTAFRHRSEECPSAGRRWDAGTDLGILGASIFWLRR